LAEQVAKFVITKKKPENSIEKVVNSKIQGCFELRQINFEGFINSRLELEIITITVEVLTRKLAM